MNRSAISKLLRSLISIVLTASMLVMSLVFPVMSNGTEDYDLPWLWPVPDSYKINSLDYYYGGGIHSSGNCMDIGANGYTGDNRLDVISATNGTVLYIVDKYDESTDRGSGWGNYVIVTSGKLNIVYAHLKSVTCGYGQIKAGDVVGKMGNTGNSTAVHLHIQAYPTDKNANDTSVYVFDRYIDNPLYINKFQFMKGLETNSVRYGEYISKNYTRLSSSYYGYTGNGSYEYPVTPVCAIVAVINTDGAPVRSVPLNDNSYIKDTAVFMEKLEIDGVYKDAYGKIWLELAEDFGGGRFVCYDDVGFFDYGFSVSANDLSVPEGAYGGYTELPFGGYITSKNTILSFTAIIRSGDKEVASYTEYVSSSTASLNGIYEGLEIDYLNDGEYTFALTVKEIAQYPGAGELTKETEIADSEFSIHSELSDKTPPVIEKISFDNVTSRGFTVMCKASDNRGIAKVTYTLYDSGDAVVSTADAVLTNGLYSYEFSGDVINDECRTYKVLSVVTDAYGNSVSETKQVNLPQMTKGELWKATIALKIRSGPGTSYTHLSSIGAGNTFRIYEAERIYDSSTKEGYIWGHHSSGYSPLGDYEGKSMYTTYVDGNLYTLMFDLNGADGTVPAPIAKRFSVDAKIPSTTYKRNGFTFLGWSTDSGATEPEYLPSATYSADSDAVLYAVWGDNEKPIIDNVILSETKWTSGSVILKTLAHDNSGTLLYSFDFGRTWQASDSIEVSENKTYPARSIAVRDMSENVTYLEKEVVISNIDNAPPDASNAATDIGFSSGRTVFTVSGVFDSESGLSEIELVYSNSKEFTTESTVNVTNGGSAVISDGVYYSKLIVTDKAGNKSQSDVMRFRVGTPEKLSSPKNTKVLSTGSGSAELAWDAVDNADKYEVNISKSGLFDDEISAYVRSAVYEISGLEPGVVYSFRVMALCDDKVYSPSDRSEVNTFLTKSDDSTVHSMKSMADAVISEESISYVAPYELTTVDITAITEEHSSVKYYSNQGLTSEITNITSYNFTTDTLTLYIKVTAENGTSSVHRLDVVRAAEKATLPSVKTVMKDDAVYVGDELDDMSVIAESTDGGTISVEWFMSYNGSEYVSVGNDSTLAPTCSDKAGVYKLYAKVTNRNDKCKTKTASSVTSTVAITVNKHVSDIGVYCANTIYNEKTPAPSVFGYLGDGVVLYYYYSDPECKDQIDAPADAGTYYVKAYAVETDEYLSCMSTAVKFIISKAENGSVPEYNTIDSTLRNRNSYMDVLSDGAEYRVKGTEPWISVKDSPIEFPEGTVVELRYSESKNYLSGKTVDVTLKKFEGAFDIVPKESSDIREDNGILYITGKVNTVSDVLAKIENSSGMNIYSASGALLPVKDGIVGTGCKIVIEDEEGIFTSLEIAVLGDIDGDGDVTRDDVLLMMSYSNGTVLSESRFDFLAGDLNGDGKLTASDAYLIYQMT